MLTLVAKDGAITKGAPSKGFRANEDSQAILAERDAGPPSARTSSKGALIAESHAVFRLLGQGMSLEEAKEACLRGRSVLKNPARNTRARIWDAVNWRYFLWQPPRWVLEDLKRAALDSSKPNERFKELAYLHYARRDRLTFDFVTQYLFQNWQAGARTVRRDEVWRFALEAYAEAAARFRESTRKKIAGNMLSALRDFAVLRGIQRKTIQQPHLDHVTALHLCRLLYEEGCRGNALIEASDWRLFLLVPHDVTSVLGALAKRGALRFEKAGRTVILELLEGGA